MATFAEVLLGVKKLRNRIASGGLFSGRWYFATPKAKNGLKSNLM